MNKTHSLPLMVFVYFLLSLTPASADDSTLRIVTSFTILEDLVQELGGEHVRVVNLVSRNSDAHTYRPKPSDSVAIANADLVVFNGLGFEGWISRLIEDTGKANKQLIASRGVNVLRRGKETDPHAWQSFDNIRIYITNITDRLVTLMPEHQAELARRQSEYLDSLNELERHLSERLKVTPINKRIVVTSHDAFGYLGSEFDIQFLAPQGLSLDAEASAEEVASVIDQIREQNVTALFLENINNPRLLENIAAETNIAIGGRLYSDALSELDGSAATYLDMMRHNIESLISAFNVAKADSNEAD